MKKLICLQSFINSNKRILCDSSLLPLLSYHTFFNEKIQNCNLHNNEVLLAECSFSLREYNSFKNIGVDILVSLRIKVAKNDLDDVVQDWCEKILRYVEIRYAQLKTNEIKFNRTNEQSIKNFTQIVNLFIDYYLKSKDLRFINTALKLMDLDWIEANEKFACVATVVLYKQNQLKLELLIKNIFNE